MYRHSFAPDIQFSNRMDIRTLASEMLNLVKCYVYGHIPDTESTVNYVQGIFWMQFERCGRCGTLLVPAGQARPSRVVVSRVDDADKTDVSPGCFKHDGALT